MEHLELIPFIKLAAPFVGLAVVWGSTLQKIKGNEKRLDSHSRDLRDHIKEANAINKEVLDRLARIETKQDTIIDKQ